MAVDKSDIWLINLMNNNVHFERDWECTQFQVASPFSIFCHRSQVFIKCLIICYECFVIIFFLSQLLHSNSSILGMSIGITFHLMWKSSERAIAIAWHLTEFQILFLEILPKSFQINLFFDHLSRLHVYQQREVYLCIDVFCLHLVVLLYVLFSFFSSHLDIN